MMSPFDVPPVADNELLARFIVQKKEFRADGTVTPHLFVPFSFTEISVNRHRESTADELWAVGRSVAELRGKTLYGLANIRASACRNVSPLDVIPQPIPGNPNHADIAGFPPKKEDQLSLGQKLAAAIEGPWLKEP